VRIGEKEGQGRGYGGKRNGEVKAGKERRGAVWENGSRRETG